MAEKKAVGHAYNIDFLNVIFAASSIVLFLSVIWMVWDDYDREWKDIQRRFVLLEQEVTRASIEQARRRTDRDAFKHLQGERQAAQRRVGENQARVQELESQLAAVHARLYRVTQDYQFAKADYDVAKYDYEALRDRNPEAAKGRADALARQLARVESLNLDLERTTAESAALQQELARFQGQLAAVDEKLAGLTAEAARLEKRLSVIAPSVVKTYFRDAPLLDFMAPSIKIQQVITPTVLDDVNFTRVPKMDRCMTCHLAIDKKGYENRPQPYRTHSSLSAYVGSDSPHPLDRVGCTVCHEGMGQSVSFRDAAHRPRDERQEREWEEKYHWEEPHLWDLPMLPGGMTEASCAKCHRREVYVPAASRLNAAYAAYERAGCYACHKTKGFENLRKPGPDLTRIDAKLTPDWVKTWIRNPRAVKPITWMPKAWYTSNSSAPDDAIRNEAEIAAAAAYLFANTAPYTPAVPSPPQGNADRGKALLESVGCLACHVVDAKSRTEAGPQRTFGQPLLNIGSKTTYEWLFNWVRDPKHYSPNTYMPDLRLTDPQVADVATYLSTLKLPAAGEGSKATPDQQAVDQVLFEYLRSVMPVEEARARVADLDAGAKQLDLGRRVIQRYGCFSCHEIRGFERERPIGVELTEEGSKLVGRLDFAFAKIPHTKLSWFRQKMRDPRVFDSGRVLRPEERLRMPDYGASDEEAEWLVTAIMSFQRDVQPLQALAPRSARADALAAGRALVRQRNCVSCHEIEGRGGEYRALVSDPSLAPPLLTPEGAKVQPDWLYAFFRGPITIRPWLDVRMPTFGLNDESWNQVIRYFEAISETIGPFRSRDIALAGSVTGAGHQLFTLLKCQQCHVLGTIPAGQPTGNLAPDLRMASERLQPDWILEWLRTPARIQPGTRMPAFWPEFPKSYYPHVNGSAEAQIRAIRDYLLTLRGGPTPKRPTAAGDRVAASN